MLRIVRDKDFNKEFIYQIFEEAIKNNKELNDKYEEDVNKYISLLSFNDLHNINDLENNSNLLLYLIYKIQKEKYNNYQNLTLIDNLISNESNDYIFTKKDLQDKLKSLKSLIQF